MIFFNEVLEELLLEQLYESSNQKVRIPTIKPKNQKNSLYKKWKVGQEIRTDKRFIEDAIQYGMLIKIVYRKNKENTRRIIAPMVYGRAKDGSLLLRAYQIEGESQSEGELKMSWRLFKPERIQTIENTGKLFRTEPHLYTPNDSVMRGGTLFALDLKEVEKNQERILKEK